MNLNINIDLKETIQEFALKDEQVKIMASSVKQAILMEIYRNWAQEAQNQLNSTRSGYLKGLIIFDEGEGKGGVKLVGKLNNMLENGVGSWDMKTSFMNSAKVRMSKKGNWYMYIPFRFATPGAKGDSEVFSGVLPREIYDIIRSKSGNKPTLTASDIPSDFGNKGVRKSIAANTINNGFSQYMHKSSMYEGIVRSMKTYPSGAVRSTYNSFRAVGAMSDPSAFINSGIKQYNLAKTAIQQTDIDLISNNTVDRILSDYGF